MLYDSPRPVPRTTASDSSQYIRSGWLPSSLMESGRSTVITSLWLARSIMHRVGVAQLATNRRFRLVSIAPATGSTDRALGSDRRAIEMTLALGQPPAGALPARCFVSAWARAVSAATLAGPGFEVRSALETAWSSCPQLETMQARIDPARAPIFARNPINTACSLKDFPASFLPPIPLFLRQAFHVNQRPMP